MGIRMVPFKLTDDVSTFAEKMGLWYNVNIIILVLGRLSRQ